MSGSEHRLDRVEALLTPRQAVLLWRKEAQSFGTLQAYVDSLRWAPDSAYPLHRLGTQMEASAERPTRIGLPRRCGRP